MTLLPSPGLPVPAPRVTIWHEFCHEHTDPRVAAVYPQGLHRTLETGLRAHGLDQVRTVTLDDPGQGLTPELLAGTDVLLWWGHQAHDEVTDEAAQRVVERVWEGMGLIALHSAHLSKPFKRLMGTSCGLHWREANDRERLWVVNPAHPIVQGIGEMFELPTEEMYGEPFDIPAPDELVLISWFSGGEVFRSGCTFTRGHGRIFYFRPGHETHPTYHWPQVQRVLANAVRWAAPTPSARAAYGPRPPLEELPAQDG